MGRSGTLFSTACEQEIESVTSAPRKAEGVTSNSGSYDAELEAAPRRFKVLGGEEHDQEL
eukprot:1516782-Prymnesium_polylepis.1